MNNCQKWISTLTGYEPEGTFTSAANSEYERLRKEYEIARSNINSFLKATNEEVDPDYLPYLSKKELETVFDFLLHNFSSYNERKISFYKIK